MPSEEIYKKVVELVSKDRTEDAIKTLQTSLEKDPNRDPKTYHSVILLISQYNNWENLMNNNIKRDAGELNRINAEILEIASDLAHPENQLRVPENYVPPPPSMKPVPPQLNPQQPLIQKTINTAVPSAKKENWATPTRILAVVGGLFLLILAGTMIFPSDEDDGNPTSPAGTPSPMASYAYMVPENYPSYCTDINQANFGAIPAANQFLLSKIGNRQWSSIDEYEGQYNLQCNAAANDCGLYYLGSLASPLNILGFADDGYAYFQANMEGVLVYFAAEFDEEIMRLYFIPDNVTGGSFSYIDFQLF